MQPACPHPQTQSQEHPFAPSHLKATNKGKLPALRFKVTALSFTPPMKLNSKLTRTRLGSIHNVITGGERSSKACGRKFCMLNFCHS